MIKYEIKPISSIAWIVSHGGNRLGMILQIADKFRTMGIDDTAGQSFDSLDQLFNKLNGTWTFETTQQESYEEAGDIEGYPVKHAAVFDVQHQPIITYKKSESSDTRFAAGYWAVLFANGWVNSLCPKKETLDQYRHIGPFKTKLELNHAISCENKKSKELTEL